MQARITLMGMENQLRSQAKSIADNWVLSNENFDKDVLLATIVMKGGMFEPLYTDPLYFREMSTFWWLKWSRTFTDWFDAMDLEYNPIEDYEKNDLIQETTKDAGTIGTSTSDIEVIDTDTTSTNSGTKQEVLDRDTTDSGTTSNREEVDQDSTDIKNSSKVTDTDTTSSTTENGNITEVTDDYTTYNKTIDSKEIIDDDNTLRKTGNVTEVMDDDKGHTGESEGHTSTENKVSAFDSNTYQPHDMSTTSSSTKDSFAEADDRTTVTTYNTTDTGTDDRTTTVDSAEGGTGTDDKTVSTDSRNTAIGSDTLDTTETTQETGSGTLDKVTNESGTSSNKGTEDATTDTTYADVGTGTLDTTKNRTGSLNTTTANLKDLDRILKSTGLVGFLHTRQGLLKEELDIRSWNCYEHIADIFVKELTVRVY